VPVYLSIPARHDRVQSLNDKIYSAFGLAGAERSGFITLRATVSMVSCKNPLANCSNRCLSILERLICGCP